MRGKEWGNPTSFQSIMHSAVLLCHVQVTVAALEAVQLGVNSTCIVVWGVLWGGLGVPVE